MIAFFYSKQKEMEYFFVTLIFVISVMYMTVSYESVDELTFLKQDECKNIKIDDIYIDKWTQEYAHPLIVGSASG